jgi:hypothetical protein
MTAQTGVVNGISYRELAADGIATQAYMAQARVDGLYHRPFGERLDTVLTDLAPIWDHYAHQECPLSNALTLALPDTPHDCPTALQYIHTDVLARCSRIRPGGFRKFADVASIATETTNRQAVLEYLERVLAILSAHPLP